MHATIVPLTYTYTYYNIIFIELLLFAAEYLCFCFRYMWHVNQFDLILYQYITLYNMILYQSVPLICKYA